MTPAEMKREHARLYDEHARLLRRLDRVEQRIEWAQRWWALGPVAKRDRLHAQLRALEARMREAWGR